jgi:hypothetical protein
VFTQAEDEQLTELVKQDLPWTLIGNILNRSGGSVYRRFNGYLRYSHPDSDQFGRRLTQNAAQEAARKARDLEILRLVDDEGVSFVEAGLQVGLSHSQTRYRYNAACSSEKRTNGFGSLPYTEHELELVASGLRQEMSLLDIARSLGSNRTALGVGKLINKSKYLKSLRPELWRKFTPEEDAVIRAAMQTGSVSNTKLSSILNRTLGVVRRRVATLRQRPQTPPVGPSTDGKSNGYPKLQHSNETPTLSDGLSHPNPEDDIPKKLPRPFPFKRWTEKEELLLLARPEGERLKWDEIAKLFPGRTPGALSVRYSTLRGKPRAGARNGYPSPASARS